MANILVIEEDVSVRDTLHRHLHELGHQVVFVQGKNECLESIRSTNPEIVFLNIRLSRTNDFDTLQQVRDVQPSAQIVAVTDPDDISCAIKSMQLGAYDFIAKPIRREVLHRMVESALQKKVTQKSYLSLDGSDEYRHHDFHLLIGKTKAMNEICKQVAMITKSNVSVLIQGESGTGKELIARVIHKHSPNGNQPFIAVNCSALPEGLLESELFGHVKGSFTGAYRDQKGKFELAEGGTIMLDEVSELPPILQGKILRVLQEREFVPIGSDRTHQVKARVIAASNQDLKTLVQQHRFRLDLYYRLNIMRIDVPTLRERLDDLPFLILHFMNKTNYLHHTSVYKLPYEVIEMLQAHPWHGNIRELENVILKACMYSTGDVLEKDSIQLDALPTPHATHVNGGCISTSLAAMEKEHIREVLNGTNWDKHKAAEILGISRPTLYNKIKAYNIHREEPGENHE